MVVPLMISNLITALAWVALAAPNAGFLNIMMRSVIGVTTTFNIYSFWGITLVFVLHYASLAFVALYAALQSIDCKPGGSLLFARRRPAAHRLRDDAAADLADDGGDVPAGLRVRGGKFLGAHAARRPRRLSHAGILDLPRHGQRAGAARRSAPPPASCCLWIGLGGTLWQRHITKAASRYVTIGGKGGRSRLTRLGGGRSVATALVVVYLFFAVGLPYATLGLGSFLDS